MSFIFPAGIGSYLKGLLNPLQINNAASAERRSPLWDGGEVDRAERGALQQAAPCTPAEPPEGAVGGTGALQQLQHGLSWRLPASLELALCFATCLGSPGFPGTSGMPMCSSQLSGASSHELTGANCCFCSTVRPCGQSGFASKQLVIALIRALGGIMPWGEAEKGSAPEHSCSPPGLPGGSQPCLGISPCLELCLGKDLPLPEL